MSVPHPGGICCLRILMAIQMQQAMDDVPQNFTLHDFSELLCLPQSRGGADDEFPVLERDYIRRAGDIEKPPVNLRDYPIRNERDFYLHQTGQHS